MFERYTESARRVLFFSRYEASQFGSRQIASEHLLLGLLRENKGLLAHVLAQASISPENVRTELAGRLTLGEKLATSVEIPFAQQTQRALSAAAGEADSLGHNYIGSEHLLLGLLRVEDSVAAAVLSNGGLNLAGARQVIAARPPGEFLVTEDARMHVDQAWQLIQRLSVSAKLNPEAADVITEILGNLDRLRRLL